MSGRPDHGLVIGVDVGTSSTKGVLVRADGTVVAQHAVAHEVERPHPGHVEMDAEHWWEEFVAIARVLAPLADAPITAVGVSGMGPCALVADEQGRPLRPAILYGVDTRATEQIGSLERELGAPGIAELSGNALSSQSVGPKLRWIADHEPEVWRRARRLFMPASWLAWMLTGAYGLDHHSASQSHPLYDLREQRWSETWQRIAPEIAPPPLRWAGERIGEVSASAAALTGLPAGIPVTTGTIDAWSEAVSVGAEEDGRALLMYGTTMFLIATGARTPPSDGLWNTVGTRPGLVNVAAGTATAGAVTAWLASILGAEYPELLAEAEASPPGARGLLLLPTFAGERSPIADPDLRGALLGLTVTHTRGDLYRAALEGTAFGIRRVLDALAEAGTVMTALTAAGGGTLHPLWPQIVSDVCGVPQVIPQVTIGASYGAARLAAELVDAGSTAAWNPPERRIQPDPRLREHYDELYREFLAATMATTGSSHALAELQRRRDARPGDGEPPAAE